MSDDSDGQRQCRRGVTVDVELDAAMALADMAGVGPAPAPGPGHQQPPAASHQPAEDEDEEELASTRLSLELGKVGIQSSAAASPCSSSSSAGHHQPPPHHPHPAAHQQQQQPATGYGPRPRHMLTEAEKEAKRLRRVLANRESARQTILRRQAIRDELARKVADLSSQNDNMKKEKDMVMQEYLSLKEANKQLKEQVARTSRTKQAPSSTAAAMPIHVPAAQQQGAPEAMALSPPATPPRPGFLYTAAPPAVPVPYVWGSWPPAAGYEHHHHGHHGSPPPICLPPSCAWYYHPVVAADPRGGSPSHAYPAAAFQPQQEPAGSGSPGAGGGGATAEDDTDDDPCSLTLALDVDVKRSAAAPVGGVAGPSDRDKASAAAEARKRRKELTKLKHMHAAGRPAGDQW